MRDANAHRFQILRGQLNLIGLLLAVIAAATVTIAICLVAWEVRYRDLKNRWKSMDSLPSLPSFPEDRYRPRAPGRRGTGVYNPR